MYNNNLPKYIALADAHSLKRASLLYDAVIPIYSPEISPVKRPEFFDIQQQMPLEAGKLWIVDTESMKALVESSYGFLYPGNPLLIGSSASVFVPVFSNDKLISDFLCRSKKAIWQRMIKKQKLHKVSSHELSNYNFKRALFIAAFKNIKYVDEFNTSWDQIIEVKKDAQALSSYRNLINISSQIGTLKGLELVQKISEQIDNYEWAIRKHGLKTITGVLSIVLAKETILISMLAGALGAAAGGELIASLLAGIPLATQVVIKLIEQRIEYNDLVRTGNNDEIAIIYNEKKRIEKYL